MEVENNQEKEKEKQSEEKIILFPGDQMPFNRKLLPYNIFSFKKEKTSSSEKHFLSCMKPVILYPNRLPKAKTAENTKESNEADESLIPSIYYGNYYYPKIGDIVIG